MDNNDLKRLPRLTAILTLLQTKRLVTARSLADKFDVNIRTIYRDIKALEQAGVPILTEEGKGYTLMEGYSMPPVMFTESEAYALITVEQIVLKNNDTSLVREYSEAISKIRSILKHSIKDKTALLAERVQFRKNTSGDSTSNSLSLLQGALTHFNLTDIQYTDENNKVTSRLIEPFAIYSTQGNWVLIAYCRMRKDFRAFRLDRILELKITDKHFKPHQITLQTYFDNCRKKYFSDP
ncbi:helix-turn-helix transcriptional regulator [Chitinophaga varians]|uniref:helix-turn-helix transcriptional regulator n=1 Tax=Chitinophaga varians TaxID=2202339 RepID=UPI00165FD157|nr:YafY family protein [Chitinophaga varians]MBC9912565.1 YafY family transcriptional regulator [Chitinophaga varians]